MKVVVLGGYGNFGARICRALAHDPEIELVVAARDERRSATFAATLSAGARATRLDTGAADFAAQLDAVGAQLVIHTAGPFQGQSYAVAEAAAQCGAHYVDLADGRRFVCDFAQALDARFKVAGRIAVTGASTLPALSSAVIDELRVRFAELHTIDICIGPAQQAPRGEATLAAVLSCCGEAVPVWQDNQWRQLIGWANPEPVHFSHMAPRLASLCDVPDLELFPGRYAGVRNVMFRAALEVGFTQRMFALLATARRWHLLDRAAALAPWLHRFGGWFDGFGSGLGGMFVRLAGLSRQGRPLQLEWHLSADNNHGPEIPCMPAILLARRLARGETLPSGALPCAGLLRLGEFEPEFVRWNIRTETLERPV
ncbi:saccharopine dehydrogenase family protein [Paraburkholderia sp. J12]|uniref:saccharopine dehydrogenase family protein n=1 Tax=Paraburkholderia sp. J12 TaxID=2805432 RepID=UPI002ABD55C2|nr:saccharopine dehydrogenase NADP-binding domain-containing protein [Paraburkholderia sp. J12]